MKYYFIEMPLWSLGEWRKVISVLHGRDQLLRCRTPVCGWPNVKQKHRFYVKESSKFYQNHTDTAWIQTDTYIYITFNIQITSGIMILVSAEFCATCKQTKPLAPKLILQFISELACLLCEEIRCRGALCSLSPAVQCLSVEVDSSSHTNFTWPFVVRVFTDFPHLFLRVPEIWHLHHCHSSKPHRYFWSYRYPPVFSEPISRRMLFFISCSLSRHFFYHIPELYSMFPAGVMLSQISFDSHSSQTCKEGLVLKPEPVSTHLFSVFWMQTKFCHSSQLDLFQLNAVSSVKALRIT